jgi:ABC-type sugar transport system substrate-binding protein
MPARKKLMLFLRAVDNEYQELQKSDLFKRIDLYGWTATAVDAGNDAQRQFRQIEAALRAPEGSGFDILLVNPVEEAILQPLATEAARRSVGWVTLNRLSEYVSELRRAHPRVPFFCVDPDQREIGRIQGQQFITVLRGGGSVFYLCGPLSTSSARLRLAGVQIATAGSALRIIMSAADWSEAGGAGVMDTWLREPSNKWHRCIVGAQNDTMGLGARKALLEKAEKDNQPDLARVPVTGCDGLPSAGQRWVGEGMLAATVVVPTTTGRAVDLIAAAFDTGRPPPADVTLQVKSFPELDVLARTVGGPSSSPPRPVKAPRPRRTR